MQVGSHCINIWSSTQKSISLSSGEAELVAAVEVCTELVGVTQLMHDWGVPLQGRVHVDSSAAIGVAHRKGNGKLRHVKVGLLWTQQRVEEGELHVKKVHGEENPGDLCTKNLSVEKVEKHMEMMNFAYKEGRAESSLRL